MRRTPLVVLLLALGLPLLPASADASVSRTSAVVLRWVDGDTVVTSRGEVRLIGVDTPEVGRCGSVRATRLARRLAPVGSRVRLLDPSTVRDRDRYGRLLRYVVRPGGVDVGRRQIRAGSVARYDGRDGYQWHPRQHSYRRIDARVPNYRCAGSQSFAPVSTNACPSAAPIKGNRGSNGWIYHLPGQRYYAVTNPEECFKTEAAAKAAGYRPAKI